MVEHSHNANPPSPPPSIESLADSDEKGKAKEEVNPQDQDPQLDPVLQPKPKLTQSTPVERKDVMGRKNKPPKMPLAMVDLSSLSLHSPSSQIIGTPFARAPTSTPFEYPFPETPTSTSSSSASSGSASPTFYPFAFSNNTSQPVLTSRASASTSTKASPRQSSVAITGPSASPSTSSSFASASAQMQSHQNMRTYFPSSSSSSHTHNQPITPPPIPPSLTRKKLAARWGVNLFGSGSRRKSSTGSVTHVSAEVDPERETTPRCEGRTISTPSNFIEAEKAENNFDVQIPADEGHDDDGDPVSVGEMDTASQGKVVGYNGHE